MADARRLLNGARNLFSETRFVSRPMRWQSHDNCHHSRTAVSWHSSSSIRIRVSVSCSGSPSAFACRGIATELNCANGQSSRAVNPGRPRSGTPARTPAVHSQGQQSNCKPRIVRHLCSSHRCRHLHVLQSVKDTSIAGGPAVLMFALRTRRLPSFCKPLAKDMRHFCSLPFDIKELRASRHETSCLSPTAHDRECRSDERDQRGLDLGFLFSFFRYQVVVVISRS